VKRGPPRRPKPHRALAQEAAAPRFSDGDIDALQALLDAVPAPLEPLDVSSLDGFLCAVLVQPERVPDDRWLACITDDEARALPRGYDPAPLHALARRRYAELNAAIAKRQWFDPWVFELEGSDGATGEAVLPWVAGVATGFELFPGLMRLPAEETAGPLALLYRHLDPEDLEDADELLAEIESLEPVVDLEEAVEGLVRAILLFADLTRPLR
jgi:uncharacterized protein